MGWVGSLTDAGGGFGNPWELCPMVMWLGRRSPGGKAWPGWCRLGWEAAGCTTPMIGWHWEVGTRACQSKGIATGLTIPRLSPIRPGGTERRFMERRVPSPRSLRRAKLTAKGASIMPWTIGVEGTDSEALAVWKTPGEAGLGTYGESSESTGDRVTELSRRAPWHSRLSFLPRALASLLSRARLALLPAAAFLALGRRFFLPWGVGLRLGRKLLGGHMRGERVWPEGSTPCGLRTVL